MVDDVLPDQPPTFRPPTEAERPWHWQLLDAGGAEVTGPDDLTGTRFVSQSDAESWIGETWQELTEIGVDAVTLYEADRAVYGPMPLHA